MGDKHEIPLVYGVSWMVRQGRKGGWSSRLHIAQENLGIVRHMGCNNLGEYCMDIRDLHGAFLGLQI